MYQSREINYDNVKHYFNNQTLLENLDTLFIKVDLSEEVDIYYYLDFIKIAKQKGILVVVIVIRENDEIYDEDTLQREIGSFFVVDSDEKYQNIRDVIENIAEESKEEDINIDTADLLVLYEYRDRVFFGEAYSSGEQGVLIALKNALENADIYNSSLKDIQAYLIRFEIHPEHDMYTIAEGMDFLFEEADIDADIIFGTSTNRSFGKGDVKVMLMATGTKV